MQYIAFSRALVSVIYANIYDSVFIAITKNVSPRNQINQWFQIVDKVSRRDYYRMSADSTVVHDLIERLSNLVRTDVRRPWLATRAVRGP